MNRPSLLDELFAHGRQQGWPSGWLAPFHMEAEGDGNEGDGGQGGNGAGNADEFPANTPVAEMTVAQQVAYWKHQSRKHEARARARDDYDDLKAKADQYDALANASKTEQERAVEQAKADAEAAARADERSKAIPRLVDAEMRAAAAGRIEPDQLKTILEPLDRSKFLDATGEVDEQKVATFIASVAPAANGAGGQNGGRPVDYGQGRRQDPPKGSVKSGADLYAQRHPAHT